MRDDFTAATKRKLALRAGGVCSNPHCRRSTFGAQQGKDGYHNIGVAAHITAASPGGPRYDATLTPEQRRHADNGIWMCKVHGDLVDGDDKKFTVEMLRGWKRDAERRSFEALLTAGSPADGTPQGAAVSDTEKQLGGETSADVGSALARLLLATKSDSVSFKRMQGWPKHPIELNLRLRSGDGIQAFNVAQLAAAVEAFNEFAVVAQPGTGKTTTLLQVTDAIHAVGRAAAVFIPLSEWSLQDKGLIPWVLARPSFRDISERDLQQLAEHGRLVLMLDGWNELGDVARKRATAQLRALQRNYPGLGVMISTRRQALDLPIGGQTINIDLLSDSQQQEIAQALRGEDGAKLLDAAWRTPGVRELMSVPLYLTALLSSSPGAALPTTKEEILRLFVKQHEGNAEKVDALREALFGFHPQMLTAIAVEATYSANTSISDTRARAAVRAVEDRLAAQGQISEAPQPTKVLDVLVSQHTLIRSDNGTLSFQHQQFQEWYASFEVEDAMHAAAPGDTAAACRLREDFLDKHPWEEAVLFACERLSRKGADGAQAVAAAILSALSIDPLLAAEMIYRSSEAAWSGIAAKVQAFVKRWHKSGQIDRAVSFMIASGRPEFAATIWPLVESKDQEVYLGVMRAARRFRPSVLGPDAAKRLAALPDESRGHVLGELAGHSGIDGMDLATLIAKDDQDPDVQYEVIQDLVFRRGDRHVAELLADAPDAVWQKLAKQGYRKEITAPGAAERLEAERAKIKAETSDPESLIRLLTDEPLSPEGEKKVEDAIASKNFAVRGQHAGTTLYFAEKRYPAAVARGMLHRLEAGLELPHDAGDYLQSTAPIDDGPVAARALDANAADTIGITAARVAGPKTAQALMNAVASAGEKLAAALPDSRQAIGAELDRWESRLTATPTGSFVTALIARDPKAPSAAIDAVASTIYRHGSRDSEKLPLELGDAGPGVAQLLREWAETLIADKESKRYQLANLASAIGRTALPGLLEPLKNLHNEDARRLRDVRARASAGHQNVPIDLRSDASTSWGLQYREAFSRMGEPAAPLLISYLGDEEFGFDAACALKTIHDRKYGVEQRGIEQRGLFRSWPHLPDAAERRAQGPSEGDTAYADAIFAEAERLITDGSSDKQQDLAIRIARLAIGMPYRGKEKLIEKLLDLARPVRSKRELIASLVMAGETFSAEIALAGVADWIEEAKNKTWYFTERLWEIEGWLELLPFSDRPESVFEGVQHVTDAMPRPQKIERVVVSAGSAPGLSQEQLVELFRRFPRLANQHDWVQALLRRGTVFAVKTVLALVAEGLLGAGPGTVDSWWLSQQIANIAKNDPAVTEEILRLYESATSEPQRKILEHVIVEIGGAPGVMSLVRGYARVGKRFDGSMYQVLLNTAVERHSIPGSSAYNLHPVSVAPLRKKLFHLVHGAASHVTALAEASLANIDQLRDQFGMVESEPRHPDIASGKPWPREAEDPKPSGDISTAS